MKNVTVVKVPEGYSPELKKEIEKSVHLAIDTTGVLVVPESVEIYSLPVND
jgi:hypothetical protein